MNAPPLQIIVGDCLDVLRTLPDESIHCCVTSPPYWSIRDYGVPPRTWGGDVACQHDWDDQKVEREIRTGLGLEKLGEQYSGGGHKHAKIGRSKYNPATCAKCGACRGCLVLEPTPEMFVEHMVEIFREVRRVLRSDGSLWLNIGDTFSDGGNGGGGSFMQERKSWEGRADKTGWRSRPPGLKKKELVGIPWRLALGLQADGWYLRCDNIWNKPNIMPSSCRDRSTRNHEYVFHLTKHWRYYYDQVAVCEKASENEYRRRLLERKKGLETVYKLHRDDMDGQAKQGKTGAARSVKARQELAAKGTRNRRSVWTIATTPFKEAHFATFPRALPRVCVFAGTSERGCCPACGRPWKRVVKKEFIPQPDVSLDKAVRGAGDQKQMDQTNKLDGTVRGTSTYEQIGWRQDCKCAPAEPVPAVVLDPFNGSGTVGLVALKHGRRYIGIELNPEYAKMAEDRITEECGLLMAALA
jgi:DNA modification methylase